MTFTRYNAHSSGICALCRKPWHKGDNITQTRSPGRGMFAWAHWHCKQEKLKPRTE